MITDSAQYESISPWSLPLYVLLFLFQSLCAVPFCVYPYRQQRGHAWQRRYPFKAYVYSYIYQPRLNRKFKKQHNASQSCPQSTNRQICTLHAIHGECFFFSSRSALVFVVQYMRSQNQSTGFLAIRQRRSFLILLCPMNVDARVSVCGCCMLARADQRSIASHFTHSFCTGQSILFIIFIYSISA